MTVVDLVRILRRNFVILLVCALVGAAAAMVYVFTRPVTYVATATGMVVAGDSASVGGALSGNSVAQQRASAYVTLIGTQAVAKRTQADLQKMGNPAAANGTMTGEAVKDTSFINVQATGSTAKNAQDLANAGLQALISEALRMETYGQTGGDTTKSDAELSKLTSIHVLGYESAGLPSAPRTNSLVTYGLLGLLVGLVVGAIIAIIRRQLDVKIRSQKDVEELTGAGVMAIIPEDKKLAEQRESGTLELTGLTGESFRQLRTNLRFANVDNPPRAVVVTSANPGDGKSTIATHLAVVMAQSGEEVVLIDADLRRPMQHKAFGIDSGAGLSQVLAGDVAIDHAMVQTDVPHLRLLTAGRVPPNPSELLGSRRMGDLIKDLTGQGYFVILDAPPILAVTDAGLLGAYADGVLLVSVVGKTHREQLTVCCTRLEQVKATLLGSVLTKAPRKAMGDVMYGYGASTYGYHSYYKKGYYTYESSDPTNEAQAATVVPPEHDPYDDVEAPRHKSSSLPRRRAR